MDHKLKKHKPVTKHPIWNFKGERIDLREISDRKATALLKEGFKLIEKVASTTSKD